MTESLYLMLQLSIIALVAMGIVILVRARRKRERIYYWGSVVTFLLAIAGVVALFEQHILSFAIFVAAALLCIPFLPKTRELQRKETVKQVQETDASAPFEMKDFLTWKAWIKIKARHGYRTMIIFYSIVCIAIFAVYAVVLVASGLINSRPYSVFYLFFVPVLMTLLSYRQFHKALKEEQHNKKD